MNNQDVIKPAGFWIRLVANIVDSILMWVPFIIIGFLVAGTIQGNTTITVLSYVVSLLYSLLLPVLWSGYTIGKRIFGIRIIKVNGEKLGIGAMIMRVVIAGIIYGISLGIAVIVSAIMVAVRKDKRAIHDFIAGTYVTYEKP